MATRTYTIEKKVEQYIADGLALRRRSVEFLVQLGQLLIKAKDDLGHGKGWSQVKKALGGETFCEDLMKIANHNVLSNSQNFGVLPPSWPKLRDLCEVKNQGELDQLVKDGKVFPGMSGKAAKAVRTGSDSVKTGAPEVDPMFVVVRRHIKNTFEVTLPDDVSSWKLSDDEKRQVRKLAEFYQRLASTLIMADNEEVDELVAQAKAA